MSKIDKNFKLKDKTYLSKRIYQAKKMKHITMARLVDKLFFRTKNLIMLKLFNELKFDNFRAKEQKKLLNL